MRSNAFEKSTKQTVRLFPMHSWRWIRPCKTNILSDVLLPGRKPPLYLSILLQASLVKVSLWYTIISNIFSIIGRTVIPLELSVSILDPALNTAVRSPAVHVAGNLRVPIMYFNICVISGDRIDLQLLMNSAEMLSMPGLLPFLRVNSHINLLNRYIIIYYVVLQWTIVCMYMIILMQKC